MKGSWWPFGSDNGDVLEEARGLLLVGEQNLSCFLCLPRCLSCFCGWCISTHVDSSRSEHFSTLLYIPRHQKVAFGLRKQIHQVRRWLVAPAMDGILLDIRCKRRVRPP